MDFKDPKFQKIMHLLDAADVAQRVQGGAAEAEPATA